MVFPMEFSVGEHLSKMKGIRDWVFSQLVSGSLILPRPLVNNRCVEEQRQSENIASSVTGLGLTQSTHMATSPEPADILPSTSGNQEGHLLPPCDQVVLDPSRCIGSNDKKKSDPFSKIEALQVKFFRILHRLGHSAEDILVAKVLYRIHLATLIRAGESDLKRVNLKSDKARALAAEQEAASCPLLDFPIRILVLGKTGAGKSATINSLFNQTKATTNAFCADTDRIREVTGNVNGIQLTVIDTPGFWAPADNTRRNKKILSSIKRYIRKFPPDVVLYVERLDNMNKGYSDLPLLRALTEVFGPAMWFNTILVMTHSAAAPPEGPNGFPLSYDSYVTHCSELLQRYIQLAVGDQKIEIPVVLAENHPQCRTNTRGEKILPNGLAWKQQLLFLSACTKVLVDANAFLRLQGSIELGPSRKSWLPSLPHLLSSFLRQRSMVNQKENEVDEFFLSDDEEDDEYDKLPPIRILKKSQFEKLSDARKKDYLDELDYREILFLKEQMKEESRRRTEKKPVHEQRSFDEDHPDTPEVIQFSETEVPPSFDSDSPLYRYRGVLTTQKLVWKPALDPHGWDHDMGFDGVGLENSVAFKKNLTASVSGEMRKDKQDFSIHSQSCAAYEDLRGHTYSVGLDVQTSGQEMLYTIQSNANFRNMRKNITGCGVSVMSVQNKYYIGTKIEDTIFVGKRLRLVMDAGRMSGGGQGAAYGGGLEATVRGRDYPVRNDRVSVAVSALSFKKDLVLGGTLETEFSPSRSMRLSVNANINNQKMGKISVKMTSSENLEVAFIALFTMLRAISRKKEPNPPLSEAPEFEGILPKDPDSFGR